MALAYSPHRALRVIAAYKLLKASALLLVAFSAFGLVGQSHLQWLSDWIMGLPIHHGHGFLVRVIDKLFELGPRKFIAIGAAACVYAVVFTVEGWGLWREKRWAEYLTVVVTASLIPLEGWEIFRHVTWLKVLALVVNVAIVLYLIRLLRRPASPARSRD
ncbi:MAG TPA: DUF2127 domain-containing protein [Paraburkholderia sp.]